MDTNSTLGGCCSGLYGKGRTFVRYGHMSIAGAGELDSESLVELLAEQVAATARLNTALAAAARRASRIDKMTRVVGLGKSVSICSFTAVFV